MNVTYSAAHRAAPTVKCQSWRTIAVKKTHTSVGEGEEN